MNNIREEMKKDAINQCDEKIKAYQRISGRENEKINKIVNRGFLGKIKNGFSNMDEMESLMIVILSCAFYLILAIGGVFNGLVHIFVIPFLMLLLVIINALIKDKVISKDEIESSNRIIDINNIKEKAYKDLISKMKSTNEIPNCIMDFNVSNNVIENLKEININENLREINFHELNDILNKYKL